MRPFQLEVFLSKWEFDAAHHMTASDIEARTVDDLLQFATDAQREAFSQLSLGYTHTRGDAALRQAIASTYDVVTDDDVLCLAGAQEGLYALARVLLGPDDHAVVMVPNYQSAESVPLDICATSGVALRPDASSSDGWRLDVDDVKAALQPNTKLVSLNLPHNPTGHLLPAADFDAIVELCQARGIHLLCDEVYRGVELDDDDRLPQVADVYERGISLNVMSKAYGLPGLRVGWVACRDAAVLDAIERYKHYLSICNAAPSEQLALFALQGRQTLLDDNRALLRANVVELERLVDDFGDLIDWRRPRGGCIAFPKVHDDVDGEVFCQRLLQEAGVLLLPSSIYASELMDVPTNRFRIGFGRRQTFHDGLAAMRSFLDDNFGHFKPT